MPGEAQRPEREGRDDVPHAMISTWLGGEDVVGNIECRAHVR
jgi:hypothetical protein